MVLELRRNRPGDVIEVVVERGGELVSCFVELAEAPDDAGAR